jgi:hypothetical protein
LLILIACNELFRKAKRERNRHSLLLTSGKKI